jgi:probable F420-dependent oxidoreductase
VDQREPEAQRARDLPVRQDAPMHFDAMIGPTTWQAAAETAQRLEAAGFSGMVFTETGQTPWMSIAAAASAAPSLTFSTGIAVAFPISPMVAAGLAWELAENTHGRFRLGLGSQVKAHVERRYGVPFDPPGPRLREYVLAVKECLAAFRGDRKLDVHGEYHNLSLLPDQWKPRAHSFGDVKVDISAVGPWMTAMAGEVADGIHVHPFHSMHYIETRLLPAVREGAARQGRSVAEIELLVPVFIVPGDTPEERQALEQRAKTQIAFYGSTKNYAYQFDELGFQGTSARLNELLKAGDQAGLTNAITDEMLDAYAVVGKWDDVADELIRRYRGLASRVISYLTVEDLKRNPQNAGRWGEIAKALQG